MTPARNAHILSPAYVCPGAVAALARLPHLEDTFPIGASLAQWAVMGV